MAPTNDPEFTAFAARLAEAARPIEAQLTDVVRGADGLPAIAALATVLTTLARGYVMASPAEALMVLALVSAPIAKLTPIIEGMAVAPKGKPS